MPLVLLLLSLLPTLVSTKGDTQWVYEKGAKDTHDWGASYHRCNGKRQSPIALWDNDVIVNKSLPMISFINYDRQISGAHLENNGHTIKMSLPEDRQPKIRGGMLPGDYRLVQLHFHWGATNNLGSEHTFGDDHYPFEMHLVHVRGKKSLQEALRDPQGLAVLGIFYEISNELDNALRPITDAMDSLRYKNNKVEVDSVNLWTLLPHDTSNFFTYYGSLTTPPCSEVVIWTLFSETHAISVDQLRRFRNVFLQSEEKLTEGETDVEDKMLFNHRPTQPVNRRPIYARQKQQLLERAPYRRRHKVGLVRKCGDSGGARMAGLASLFAPALLACRGL